MANKHLYPARLLLVTLLVLCFGFFSIPGSASQIDIVDREDFVVDIQLTVYNVRHQYYTDGNLDGTVYDGYASDDGYSSMDSIVSGTAKLTSYGGNSYRYAYYTVDSANSILTLVYTRESAPPEPVVTDPPATEAPVTEPPETQPEPVAPIATDPPATQPEKPVTTEPPVEEVTVPDIPVEEVTQPEAEPVAEEPAPAAQEETIPDAPVPLAQTPAPETPAPEQAVKAELPPAEAPQQAEAPTDAKPTEPWLLAAQIGTIAVITLGAVLLLFSFTKTRKK